MPYRPRSTDVWHSLPGVVAAYQPIAAPDPFAARQNVAHQDARFGVYTAQPGVLPTWAAATGWTFNGTTQFLNSGVFVVDTSKFTAVIRWNNVTNVGRLFGCSTGGPNYVFICPDVVGNNSLLQWSPWTTSNIAPAYRSGVGGITSSGGYINGRLMSPWSVSANSVPNSIFIGAMNVGFQNSLIAARILSVVFATRGFSAAEMWLASRQMAYCELNPDWNAWARRRCYYYAPSAAFQAAWAARQNRLIGGGLN